MCAERRPFQSTEEYGVARETALNILPILTRVRTSADWTIIALPHPVREHAACRVKFYKATTKHVAWLAVKRNFTLEFSGRPVRVWEIVGGYRSNRISTISNDFHASSILVILSRAFQI